MRENKYYAFWAAGLIIVVFVVLQQLLGFDLAWEVGSFHPNFFFSMVAHASVAHLMGNLFGLVFFGMLLESAIGSKRFVTLLVLAGIAGNLAGIGSYNRVLGISGVVLGIIGALSVVRPKMVVFFSGMPLPMVLIGAGYAFMNVLGAFADVGNTGYLAHLGGLVVGVILGFRYRSDTGTDSVFGGQSKRSSSLSKSQKQALDNELDKYEDRYLR